MLGETAMSASEITLKPANENPWYVLMTLHGEQEGEETDWKLHEKNRKAWNLWAGQSIRNDKRAEFAQKLGINAGELSGRNQAANANNFLFDTAWKSRNGDLGKSVALPRRGLSIEIDKVLFEKKLVLDGYLFPSLLSFIDARFSSDFHAKNACFLNDVFLTSAEFSQRFVVFRAEFQGDLHAAQARFKKFGMRDTDIVGTANFRGASFANESSLTSSRYHREAVFSEAEFRANSDFSGSVFDCPAYFDGAKFSSNTKFNGVTFSKRGYFTRAQFGFAGDHSVCEPVFSDCHFDQPTTFREVVFRDAYPVLEGTLLHPKTVFTAKPEFWPLSAKQNAEQIRECCAAIRHVFAQQGLPEEAHFFFRRELGAAGKVGNCWQRLPYFLFRVFSDFGHSIVRPTLWLVGCWALGVAAFWGYFMSIGKGGLGTAIALSFSNLFPLFGFGRLYFKEVIDALPAPLAAWSGFQTVFGLPMIFFLGLGLRQRFRLR